MNSPHNPTGTVLSRHELEAIAELAIQYDILVTTDEVYGHLVYDAAQHIPLAAMPCMRDRTLTVSSASKMFNCTGWRTGWVCGNAKLIAGVRSAKQFLSFASGAPFQPAVTLALKGGRAAAVARDDALADGNERTAWAAAWTLLHINGIRLGDFDVDDAERFMNDVASREVGIDTIAHQLSAYASNHSDD